MNSLKKRLVRSYWWLESRVVQNFGDALGMLILNALGYHPISRHSEHRDVVNPMRCLLPIGSVIWPRTFEWLTEPTDVWGCGWRGNRLPAAVQERVRFHAVRGPATITGLGLPAKTPLGDPALLLPRLLADQPHQHGRTLIMPHFFRTTIMSAAQRCRLTGCHEVLSAQVIGKPVAGGRVAPTGLRELRRAYVGCGIPLRTTRQTIHAIAGAQFVLTGSLHGAIVAQAYGVPWALYSDGYVDVPAKWEDWAAYLGITLEVVTDLRSGQRWWQRSGRRARLRDRQSLLAAFPYPLAAASSLQSARHAT